MRKLLTVARQASGDLIRGRWVVGYAIFFLAVATALFAFGERTAQAMVSVLDLILLIVPFVSIVTGVLAFYNAREFAELLLSQPISRATVFFGQYLGLAIPLAAAFALGLGLPFAWQLWKSRAQTGVVIVGLAAGVFLTLIFVAFAFAIAVRTENRLKALGAAMFVWLMLSVIYDALLLGVVISFSAYPLEKVLLALAVLNPVDLARIMILLRLDTAALMGYTGAVFKEFFASAAGLAVTGAGLAAWTALPLLVGARTFIRRDF